MNMKVNNKKEREIWNNPNVKDLALIGVIGNPLILGLSESGLESINEEGAIEYANESTILY